MDWKNHLEKKSEKTVKIKVKLPHVNKKPLARKRIFVQTPFSHSTLNLERKNFTLQNHSIFSLHFLFRRDQNHSSNLTSKIMKMCEQILKKNIAGRIPETTRSENLFNRHPTTHQKTLASTNLWFSRSQTIKQKSKNKKNQIC